MFKRKGCDDAANILIELLGKGISPVSFFDIAAIRVGLNRGDLVPEEKTAAFHNNVEMIHDERLRIKIYVEEITDYRLVVVSSDGQSARSGGGGLATGFDLRDSVAGVQDDLVQVKLAKGSLLAALRRHPSLLNDREVQIQLQGITGLISQD